ncbi:MAG: GyrI-like domain-containing protein [Treponema sp.]|jgi:AraC family transcriptional regulator|nr:GyrI-like domain-containing protein [Treponema sp.]
MEAKFIEKGTIKLAGYVLNTSSRNGENFKAIPQFWGAYMSDGRMQKLHAESFVKIHAEYGVCFPEDAEGNFDYVIGVELKEGTSVPSEYHYCEIPAASYAVFTTSPSEAAAFPGAIQQTWQEIFSQWFPQSGRRMDEAALSFELYDERSMAETGKVCEIWIPVV